MKVIQIKEIAKKEIITKAGHLCKYAAYVSKGCFRFFKTNKNGVEYVTLFAFEDYWVGDMNSLMNREPAKMNVQALEDSTIMAINSRDFQSLIKTCPGFSEFTRIKRLKAYDAVLEHSVDVNESAETRYEKLLQRYPKISQRVPLYHMASYLGITPESLSRIRKNLYQN